MFTRATTDIIACGPTLRCEFCLRTAHSAALGCGTLVFFGVPIPRLPGCKGKSTPRALTRTNKGGHGCERGRRCEGSRPPGVDIPDRGAALPHAHNRRVPAVGTAPALVKGTSSIEPASRAEKAAATKLEALEPTATGHIHEAPSPAPGGGRMGKPDAPSQGGKRMSKADVPPQGGKCMDKPNAPPLEGGCMVGTPLRKGRHMHGALPLEGERERGTMPRESLCKGVLITLKSTTPGDLEVPWDPGGEERRTSGMKSTRRQKSNVAGIDTRCGVVVLAWLVVWCGFMVQLLRKGTERGSNSKGTTERTWPL